MLVYRSSRNKLLDYPLGVPDSPHSPKLFQYASSQRSLHWRWRTGWEVRRLPLLLSQIDIQERTPEEAQQEAPIRNPSQEEARVRVSQVDLHLQFRAEPHNLTPTRTGTKPHRSITSLVDFLERFTKAVLFSTVYITRNCCISYAQEVMIIKFFVMVIKSILYTIKS